MSADITGGPVFPTPYSPHDGKNSVLPTGISLRDYFAAQLMGALIAAVYSNKTRTKDDKPVTEAIIAGQAYCFADAMLAERSK